MRNYELVRDYRHHANLKESFNRLAMETFDLDFRGWYDRGYWNNRYIPYSFVDDGKIIANASIFKMSVMINGRTYNGIQLGTVMTAVDYRNQGLASQLIKEILKEYENTCDFIYLFANASVLDFYPKFGFTRLHESEFSLDLTENTRQINEDGNVRQLTLEHDLALLEYFAKNRSLNSTVLDVKQNESLLLFYFTLVFPEKLFYVEELETIVLMEEEEEDTLHVFDVISLEAPDIEKILALILKKTTKKAVFHFTPDLAIEGMTATVKPDDANALFILSKKSLLEGNFKFPLTSHC